MLLPLISHHLYSMRGSARFTHLIQDRVGGMVCGIHMVSLIKTYHEEVVCRLKGDRLHQHLRHPQQLQRQAPQQLPLLQNLLRLPQLLCSQDQTQSFRAVPVLGWHLWVEPHPVLVGQHPDPMHQVCRSPSTPLYKPSAPWLVPNWDLWPGVFQSPPTLSCFHAAPPPPPPPPLPSPMRRRWYWMTAQSLFHSSPSYNASMSMQVLCTASAAENSTLRRTS